MVSFFNFRQTADITIRLKDENKRAKDTIRTEDGNAEELFLFYDGETVEGEISVQLKKANQKLEHQGIRIDFIGQIEVYYDRGNAFDFISLSKDLARPGELMENTTFPFCFEKVSKTYESYVGCNVKLRYFIRATILRRLTDIVKEMDILVHSLASYPETDANLKMEVGIEDCLHIEFEYNRSRYHLKDVIIGKIYFLLVRIKIKFMEIQIIRREYVGAGASTYNEAEVIAKFEIMDGAPVKGETIPIRLFLAGYELGPTMRDVGKRFSVRYFLNLVLIDEEDRRYYKQQEITLFRKPERPLRKQLQPASDTTAPVGAIGDLEVPDPSASVDNGTNGNAVSTHSPVASEPDDDDANVTVN